jgi:hypothetical protein
LSGLSGTEGSNPLSSSGESGTNRTALLSIADWMKWHDKRDERIIKSTAPKTRRGLGPYAAGTLSRYIGKGAGAAEPRKLADDKRSPPQRLRHELRQGHVTMTYARSIFMCASPIR